MPFGRSLTNIGPAAPGGSIFGALLGKRATLAALPPGVTPVAIHPSVAQGMTAPQAAVAAQTQAIDAAAHAILATAPTTAAPTQAALPLQGSKGALVDNPVQQGRRQNLGFPTASPAASATATVSSAPYIYFRGDRLFLDHSQTPNFNVSVIEVGNKNQLANSNAMPGAAFSELAVNADVEYDTANPAIAISISLANQDTTLGHSITPGMTGRSAY